MTEYPRNIVPGNPVEPVPRRVRAYLDNRVVIDTTDALYVWQSPSFPQFHIPMADIEAGLLVDERTEHHLRSGTAKRYGIAGRDGYRSGVAHLFTDSELEGVIGTVHIDWSALDSWFEEDEEVFVHPRNPYVRVDALRSSRTVTVQVDGRTLARSSSPVMVFETGLPTRYYLDRTDVRFDLLVPSDTVTSCPYKGRTSSYWSLPVGDRLIPDIAWAYDFPTSQLSPIAGLVAFYNEKVDITVTRDGIDRPETSVMEGNRAGSGSTDA